mmetsp:Transcript_9679/g.21074  ORF Transcript_9679/g.21074 Transcript_9679/m.21074 type:complete len:96 (+) Transcript_9679:207-494(+)
MHMTPQKHSQIHSKHEWRPMGWILAQTKFLRQALMTLSTRCQSFIPIHWYLLLLHDVPSSDLHHTAVFDKVYFSLDCPLDDCYIVVWRRMRILKL